MATMPPKMKFATARLKASELMPYFTSGLLSLTPIEVKHGTLGTFAVTPNAVLLWDAQAVERWSVDEIAGVLVHEFLHIMREHNARRVAIQADPQLWNLATDCVATGTKVLMKDGSEQRIESLKEGDEIQGVQKGKLVSGEVIAVLSRPRGGPGVELHSSGSVLHSTTEHRVLTEDGYVRIDDAIAGETPKVFRIRDSVHNRQPQDHDHRGYGKEAEQTLPKRTIPHEIQGDMGVEAHGQEATTNSVTPVDGSGYSLHGRDSGRGRNDIGSKALQQSAEQDILPTNHRCQQYEQHTSTVDGNQGLPVRAVYKHERNAMLEDDLGRGGSLYGLLDTATLSRYQTTTSRTCARILEAAKESKTQRQADPADAPNIQGTEELEYAVCSATRTSIPEGTVYYDLVTTCHSFIANGFAVHNCEINDDLAAGLKLPDDGLQPQTFGFKPGGLAEEYYAQILQMAQQCPQCGGQGKDGKGQGDSPSGGSGKPKKGGKGQCPRCGKGASKGPGAGKGWCGSGGGRPVEQEGQHDIKQEIEEAGRSPSDINNLRKMTAEAIKDAAEKDRGSIPAGLVRWAEDQLSPPKVDWRKELSSKIRAAVNWKKGVVDHKFDRPSRRQAAMGYGPGRPILPIMRRPSPNVAIAVDTSGSMSSKDLARACSEAKGILDSVGSEVSFLACDAAIGNVSKVRSVGDLAEALVGGGGTDFTPVFHKLGTLRPPPGVLVFATDGMGPCNAPRPAGCHVIWLLIGEQATEPWFGGEPFGDFIRVEQ